jgi:hypothetical protein
MRATNRGLTGLLLGVLLGCEPTLLPEDAAVGGAAAGGGTGEGIPGGSAPGEGIIGDAARPDAADAAATPVPDATPTPVPDAAVEPAPCAAGAQGLCEIGDRIGSHFCGWNQSWSRCIAPVDVCGDGLDNDHDGVVDDHCQPEANDCVGGGGACPEWFQICIFGTCVDDEWNLDFPTCTDSADCPGFATCDDDGLCVARDCDWAEEDCPSGAYCGEGLCRTPHCAPDAFEPDDAVEAARALVPGAPPQLHSVCGGPDRLFVDAAGGEAYRLSFDAQIGHRVTIGDGPTLAEPLRVDVVAPANGRLPIVLDRGPWPGSQGTPAGLRVSLAHLGPALPAGAACVPGGDAVCATGLRCSLAPGADATTCRPTPRVDAFTAHAFDGFATAFAVEGFAPDGLPADARLMRGDGRPTWGGTLWADALPGDRFELVFVNLDVQEWTLGGPLALQLSDPVGPFFASVTDAALSGPAEVVAGARCDPYGTVRACAAGLTCVQPEGAWAGRCAASP